MDHTPQALYLEPHAKSAILKATGLALLMALVLLLVAILPAEYGIDPTGAGKALGLKAFNAGKAGQSKTIARYQSQPGKFKEHTVELTLGASQGFEYKFTVEAGAMMLYSWKASKALAYDFHGEPRGDTSGYFASYEKKTSAIAHGSLVAPFVGTHGWYWKNLTGETVTITLTTAGYYEVIGIKHAASGS